MRFSHALLALCALTLVTGATPALATFCESGEDAPMPPSEVECKNAHENGDKSSGLPTQAKWALGGLALAGVLGVSFSLRSLWVPHVRAWAAPLFARLTRRDVTDHPIRARILHAVASRPGISVADLAALERLNPGTLDYHVDVLLRDGQVLATKAGRNRILFLPGSGIDVGGVAELSAQGRSDIARLVLQEPGLHAAAIADRLGTPRATVHHHLTRLEAAGLIRIERGLRARCFPTDRLAPALDPPKRRRLAVLSDKSRKDAQPTT